MDTDNTEFTRRRVAQTLLAVSGMGLSNTVFAQRSEPDSKPGAPVALTLARIVNKTRFHELPPMALQHAKMIVASTLASAAAGRQIGSVRIIRELAEEQGGKPEATVWYHGARLPVSAAARVNAMLSDAAASDDSDLRTVAHTGTCLAAVGLAVGERAGASGQDLLAAMVAGYEAAGRVGEAIIASAGSSDPVRGALSGSVGRGFHASSIVAFGGSVAAAKLLHLTDDQMANAIGITATTVGGLSIGTNSWAREYHAGNAAQCAVHAALAASRGYTVNPDMLEAQGGFLALFSGGRPDTRDLVRDGQDWQIDRYLAIKLVPGAHSLHPAVEAAINAARESGVGPEDVSRILVAGPQSGLVASKAPKDMIEAIHSLSYYLASAVADQDFSWKNAEPEMIRRPVIARLIGLVARDPAPPPVHYNWPWGATVTIVTRSGARFTSTVDAPRGSAPRGIAWSDVDAKYHALMPQSGLPAPRIEEVLRLVHDLEAVKQVSQLTGLLSPP